MWFVFAMLSALFAALTSILAKVGMEGINSNLATAVRTAVVLVMAWGIVLLTGKAGGLADISGRGWLFWSCPEWLPACLGYAITMLCKKGKPAKWYPSTSSVW